MALNFNVLGKSAFFSSGKESIKFSVQKIWQTVDVALNM
jgi:hypothetical protein